MTRWLVTGAGGMLGSDVVAVLADQEVTALDRPALNILDAHAVLDAVDGHDLVVNCAAWTAVDDAESHEGQSFAVNAAGVANLARACARRGARMVHLSTDYVFAGDLAGSRRPYAESDPLAPMTAYGRSKAAGEWAVRAELPGRHWILRTAWLYGNRGPSFVHTMAKLAATRPTVDVVDDQFGQPTWTRDLALRIRDVVDTDVATGIYHATSTGSTSWHGFARAVFELLGADPQRVHATTSAAFARPAPRPAWSVLGHDAWASTGLAPLPSWEKSLNTAITGGALGI